MDQPPRPYPIRTTPKNVFAYNTVTHRLPANIRNVISAHPDYPQTVKRELESLAAAIAGNERIPPIPLPAWDAEYWTTAYAVHAHENWHNTEWFFGETYAFRLLLAATRYFATEVDPYGPIKRRELVAGSPFLPVQRFFGEGGPGASILDRRAGEQVGSIRIPPTTILEEALHLSMWGNRADISFTAGGELDHSAGDRELLLADDGQTAASILVEAKGVVHVVMDNSGAELAGDLVLALTIQRLTRAQVVFHVKFYPTYVSDTIVEDVHTFLRAATAHADPVVTSFAAQAQDALDAGAIVLAPDPFWCETEFLNNMPPRIAGMFATAAMVIVKGDFNYRRAVRDTIWTPGMRLPAAMGLSESNTHAATLQAIPWLLLRTMKSDCLAGVESALIDQLDRTEPGWRTDGRRGVIQLVV